MFMRMLKKLVHLNNEHSRAPLRINERMRRVDDIGDVRFWHLADIPTATRFVRYWRYSGHCQLATFYNLSFCE